MNKFKVELSMNTILLIKFISAIYTCYMFFNYIIINKHALNLFNLFMNSLNKVENGIYIFIGYLIYYYFFIHLLLV